MRACLRGKFALKKECQTPQHLVGGRITIKNFAFSPRAREESAALYREKALGIAQETAKTAVKALRGEITDALGEPVKDLPRGYVEAQKLLVQELNREAAIRDDRNYGDRRRVAVTGADGGAVKIETKQVTSLSNEELLEIARMELPENEGEDR